MPIFIPRKFGYTYFFVCMGWQTQPVWIHAHVCWRVGVDDRMHEFVQLASCTMYVRAYDRKRKRGFVRVHAHTLVVQVIVACTRMRVLVQIAIASPQSSLFE